MKAYLRVNRKRRFVYFSITLLTVITAICFLFNMINKRLEPIIEEAADNEIQLMIQKEISNIIASADKKSFDELTYYEKDNAGNISFIKTDSSKINSVNSDISLKINKKLSEIREVTIKVPLGSILKNNFISARGPDISIKVLIPKGKVTTQIVNVFVSAGINQTRHRLTLCVESEITGLIGLKKAVNKYKTEAVLSETVIVGRVPDNYISGGFLNKNQ